MTKIDLSSCENEPVRFVGMVQPFGALVVGDESGKISHVSSNIGAFLGQEASTLLGKPLATVSLEGAYRTCKKRLGSRQLIEFEPVEKASTFDLNALLNKLQTANSLPSLLQKAAEAVWELTKFNRVMVYKFHDDFHGEVVAEALLPGVESFMGLHYPASDIPPQARAIFLESWVRIIPDVNATPVPIMGSNLEGLDLGRVTMRAVSPIHIEYLKNMEVGASLTISIIVEGKLWGLFACHHRSEKYVDPTVRDAAETIGRMTSSLIRESEIKEIHAQNEKLKKDIYKLQERLQKTDDIGEELTKATPNLTDLISTEGAAAALYLEGYWATVGKVPNEKQLEDLANWLSQNSKDEVFSTNELSKVFPEARAYKEIASGLLAASIPKNKKSYILWFRSEVVQTVRWAGNPDKTVTTVNGRLTPRASFDEWKESVEGKSKPWQVWEVNAALEIKHAVIGNDLKKQFEKEKKARKEAELAISAREELMEVVSHDLRNPLSSIVMNTQLLKRFLTNADEKTRSILDRISRSSQSMSNLIEDILNVTKLEAGQVNLETQITDLHELLRDSIDVLSTLAHDKQIKLEIAPNSVPLKAEIDYGRMLQVVSNIIGNAIKFTPPEGEIIAKVAKSGPDSILITIKDSGEGIPKENLDHIFDRFWQAKEAKKMGTGLGLAIAKGVVVNHQGEIWAESEMGKGTTFSIKIPIAQS